ncbi:MAG: hypothetical protein EXS64_04155 [Candidatus Latescibacteria bacterium]|nr:hypothetical protein [Candidatus Latescibacterota bacterium]
MNRSYDRWTFVNANDLHVGSPRSYRFDPSRNENWQTARGQILALRPDLLLVGGDLTMDGCLHDDELRTVKEDLESLPFPSYVVPGNHDVGNKFTPVQGAWGYDDIEWNVKSEWLRQFASHFGPLPWTFLHKNVRFTGFYEAVAGSGLPEEAQLWDFLERLPSLPAPAHHVAMLHSPLFFDHMDEPTYDPTVREEFVRWFFNLDRGPRFRMLEALRAARVDLVITAHLHVRRPVQTVEGVGFLKAPAAGGKPQYGDVWPDGDDTLGFHRFDVTDERIDITFIPLEKVSRAEGYGPRGHPPRHLRDYSLAWEKGMRTP